MWMAAYKENRILLDSCVTMCCSSADGQTEGHVVREISGRFLLNMEKPQTKHHHELVFVCLIETERKPNNENGPRKQ
jgi:hypothetical protein